MFFCQSYVFLYFCKPIMMPFSIEYLISLPLTILVYWLNLSQLRGLIASIRLFSLLSGIYHPNTARLPIEVNHHYTYHSDTSSPSFLQRLFNQLSQQSH